MLLQVVSLCSRSGLIYFRLDFFFWKLIYCSCRFSSCHLSDVWITSHSFTQCDCFSWWGDSGGSVPREERKDREEWQTKVRLTCCFCEAVANPSGRRQKEKKKKERSGRETLTCVTKLFESNRRHFNNRSYRLRSSVHVFIVKQKEALDTTVLGLCCGGAVFPKNLSSGLNGWKVYFWLLLNGLHSYSYSICVLCRLEVGLCAVKTWMSQKFLL